jgi:hypothetical protein
MINDKLKNLYKNAGFSTETTGYWPVSTIVGAPLEKLIKLVIEDCATAAAHHARSYADGDAGSGAVGASNAVKAYGNSLFDSDK